MKGLLQSLWDRLRLERDWSYQADRDACSFTEDEIRGAPKVALTDVDEDE